MTTLSLHGVGVSKGVAIGKVHLIERNQQETREYQIEEHLLQQEIARFKIAISLARQQLRSVRLHIPHGTPGNIASFIETHLLMLEDSALVEEPVNIIRERQCNAEWAVKIQRDILVSVFDQMDDAYLRTRKDDVDHVVNRIQRILLDHGLEAHEVPDTHLEGCIILAEDLSPADTVMMQHHGIAAFVIEHGGPTSHTAILARSLGIPSIVGVKRALRYVDEGDMLIVDADAGVVLVNPDPVILEHYKQRQLDIIRYQTELIHLKEAAAITLDGIEIELQANIELEKDYSIVKKVCAKGVGLYRTEYLYMNRVAPPSEEEHYQTYIKTMEMLDNIPLTLRTMDLGSDKNSGTGYESTSISTSVNPALGLRAIRLCLKEPTLFEPQLRAVLRASAKGPLRMMLPMLSTLQEVRDIFSIIKGIKQEFSEKGIPFNTDLKIGGMIEVPAAAVCADMFAQYLDFLSIGTNDLIQYSMAIDRVNDEVNYLYDPLNPAILRLIHMTINAGRQHNIPVAMCGEMAGEPKYVRLLLGLGLREFSVHPASLLEIKRIINDSKVVDLEAKALQILNAKDSSFANEMLDSLNIL